MMNHADWMSAAATEYRRLGELLLDLDPTDWERPTDCPEWTVRALVAHLVGAAEAAASLRETLRQQRAGAKLRPGATTVDAMNAVQVAERAGDKSEELLAALHDAGRRSVRARSRIPAPLRALQVPLGPPLGRRPLGYLMDRIYTRDAWMHRIDLARATGREPALSPEHDGRIVADVVDEWAGLHRQPFTLVLSGPAGGRFGCGGERLALDAVEFCRRLAGRGSAVGLLAVMVPF